MKSANPYLNFPGNTEEAFTFYRSVLGGEFLGPHRFGDMPDAGDIPDEDRDKIMHIALPLGGGNLLMATDTLESMEQTLTPGNNFSIALDAESEEEARRIFEGLSAGGDVDMPLQATFWAQIFGMCKDRFGVQWMVSYGDSQPG